MAAALKNRLLAALCLLPCAFILLRQIFLLRLGEGIPSDDSLLNSILIGKMLDGGYEWPRLFRDAYTNGHFNFFPILAQYLWALATGWNFRLALLLGAGLATAKIVLLRSALARPDDRKWSWLLWPGLFALTFPTTAMDVFQLDSSAFQLGFNHLGLVLGVWGLARFAGENRGIYLACAGGWLAAWSWGSGAMAWPAFLLGMAMLGYRRFSQYAILLAAGALVALPYLFILWIAPISGQEPKLLGFANLALVVRSIGLIFAQGYSPEMAWWRGLAGLALAATGLGLCLGFRLEPRKWAVPAMLLLYVLLHFYQVSLFRSRLMPWYAYQASLFWIALLGIAYLLTTERKAWWWSASLMAILIYFYATSNLTWRDKIASLRHQGPVSVACLQDFRTAPKDCEAWLFRWKPFEDFREMAGALARHRLSLFGSPRIRSLQGDFFLGKVEAKIAAGSSLRWLLGGEEVEPTDFRRLELEIPAGGRVQWPVELPSWLGRAELSYEYLGADKAWKIHRSDLGSNAGQTVKITLVPGLYRFPSVLIEE